MTEDRDERRMTARRAGDQLVPGSAVGSDHGSDHGHDEGADPALLSMLSDLAAAEREAGPSDALMARVLADAARVQDGLRPPRTLPGAGRTRRANGAARPGSSGVDALPLGLRAASRPGEMAIGTGGVSALVAALVVGLAFGGFSDEALSDYAPVEARAIMGDQAMGLRVADAADAFLVEDAPF
ncbi:MAG: hypothetical protein AAF675_12070 [Pseudomonadota bacterium]